jgi:hypothetical protein
MDYFRPGRVEREPGRPRRGACVHIVYTHASLLSFCLFANIYVCLHSRMIYKRTSITEYEVTELLKTLTRIY